MKVQLIVATLALIILSACSSKKSEVAMLEEDVTSPIGDGATEEPEVVDPIFTRTGTLTAQQSDSAWALRSQTPLHRIPAESWIIGSWRLIESSNVVYKYGDIPHINYDTLSAFATSQQETWKDLAPIDSSALVSYRPLFSYDFRVDSVQYSFYSGTDYTLTTQKLWTYKLNSETDSLKIVKGPGKEEHYRAYLVDEDQMMWIRIPRTKALSFNPHLEDETDLTGTINRSHEFLVFKRL